VKTLFATYREIRGVESNEAKSNGANIAIIAMGSPLLAATKPSKNDEQVDELIRLLYVNQLVDAQLPDLDQLVIYLGHHGIEETFGLGAYFLSKNQAGNVLFVSCDCDTKKKNLQYQNLNLPKDRARIFQFSHADGLETDRVMQVLLQRFLALGTLQWPY